MAGHPLTGVASLVKAGRSLEETEAACTSPWAAGLSPALTEALDAYTAPPGIARQRMLELCRNLHRLNVMTTYQLYTGADRLPASETGG